MRNYIVVRKNQLFYITKNVVETNRETKNKVF